MARRKISLAEARRIALTAQGFDRPRPRAEVNAGHIARVIRRLGLLQLDYVNVLVPAHQLVVFSRLGEYDRDRFHSAVYRSGGFTEQWAHEASIVPTELWPLLAHRRQAYQPYKNSPIMKLKGRSRYLAEVLDIAQEKAPLTSQDLEPLDAPKRRPGDWNRSVQRWALEYHFGKGNVVVADRQANFQRVYDLPERHIDERLRTATVSQDTAQRELLLRAADALGVATLHDLADYFRMSPRHAAPRVMELVESGELREVSVEGWAEPAYLAKSARLPRALSCGALLSPFDPVVWFRPRAERLFNFHYRIEIYVPAPQRKWGYYVLPFLLDDRIVARLDLKADRKGSTLLVLASHAEADIDEQRTLVELARELYSLAGWLELERIKVSRRGPFARKLAAQVRSHASAA